MGLWQTGYFEFHQETGLYESYTPQPVWYTCGTCGSIFDSQDALFEHRFQLHPFKRPTLLLNGIEITSPHELIANQLDASDLVFGHVDRCYLNGVLVEKDDLTKTLANKKHGLISIVLESNGVQSTYQLDFDVPDEKELFDVEQLFFETVGGHILDMGRIDLFIDMTARFKSTKRYVDGLSQYLYGILAKDQRGGTMLERSDYTTKINQALDILRHFDRPLALAVVGVVNFNQNVFDSTNKLFAAPKARSAMLKFNNYVTGNVSNNDTWTRDTSASVRKIPLDYATEKIYEWSSMLINELIKIRKELEHSLKSHDWVANDKFKVQMLLAELLVATDDFPAAIRIAGSFSNDTVFGPWAQRILEKKI